LRFSANYLFGRIFSAFSIFTGKIILNNGKRRSSQNRASLVWPKLVWLNARLAETHLAD
jgi:hypothetical protein